MLCVASNAWNVPQSFEKHPDPLRNILEMVGHLYSNSSSAHPSPRSRVILDRNHVHHRIDI